MTSIFGFTAKTDGVDDHLAAHVNSLQGAADVLSGGIQGQMWNGQIDVSFSAGFITVKILTLAGATPSASDPVIFRVGNSLRKLEAELLVNKAGGTNWFDSGSVRLATEEIEYFVYIIWDTVVATDELDIGFARSPHAVTTLDLSATTTNQFYIATGNGSAVSVNNECEVIGSFKAVLSGTATFLWSAPATQQIINRPVYETDWLIWNTAQTGYSSDPSLDCFYRVRHHGVDWIISVIGTGTSNATTVTHTLPFTAWAFTSFTQYSHGNGQDNGTACSPMFRVVNNTNILDAFKGPGTTAWTNSGTKFCEGSGNFRIS